MHSVGGEKHSSILPGDLWQKNAWLSVLNQLLVWRGEANVVGCPKWKCEMKDFVWPKLKCGWFCFFFFLSLFSWLRQKCAYVIYFFLPLVGMGIVLFFNPKYACCMGKAAWPGCVSVGRKYFNAYFVALSAYDWQAGTQCKGVPAAYIHNKHASRA